MPGPLSAGQLWIDIGADTHVLERDLNSTKRKFNNTLNSMQSRMRTFATNMTRMWHTALLGFAVFGVTAGTAISQFASLEQAQTDLAKRMNVSRDAIEGITSELTKLSMTMPTTRKELTEIAVSAAQVGVARENIVKFVQVMKQFEIATGRAADEAAKDFKRIMNVTGEPISNVENLGSELATLVDQFPVADVETIMQVMIKMGRTMGAAMNVSSQELASLSVMVSSMAKRAARPASQMRKLFTEMATDTEKFAQIAGVSMEKMTAAINEGPVQAVISLIEELRDVPGAVQRFQALADVSRTTAKAIAPLIEFLPSLKDALREGGIAFKENTELMDDYEKEMKNISTQLKVSWGNLQTFTQTIGQALTPALRNFNKNVLKPFTSNLVMVVNNSKDAREAIADFILTGLKVTGIAVAVGALAKMFAFLLGPIGMAITTMVALWAAWELNIYGVRDALQQIGQAWDNITDLDTSGLAQTLSKMFTENPVPTAITLSIIGFSIARLAGVSITSMIAGALWFGVRGITGATVGGAMIGLAKGFAIPVVIALSIKEFMSEQNRKELGKKWEESNAYGKAKAVVTHLPLTVGLGLYSSYFIFKDFAYPALSVLSTRLAGLIPWYISGGMGMMAEGAGVSLGTAVLGGITLALSIGMLITMFNKFKTSKKEIPQQIMENLGAVLIGGAIGAGFGSVLGNPVAGAAIGIGSVTLLLEITKLIPKFDLGAKKPGEQLRDKLDEKGLGTIEGGEIKVDLSKFTVEDYKNKMDKIMKIWNNWAKQQGDFPTNKIERLKELISEIQLIMGRLDIKDPAASQLLQNMLSTIEAKGFQFGGFVPGTGSGDIVPAMLEPGEFVWPREMVQKYSGLIKGMWQGFRKGGSVSKGTHYYGPGPEEDEGGVPKDPFSSLRTNLQNAIDSFSKWLLDAAEDTEKAQGVINKLRKTVNAILGPMESMKDAYEWAKQETDKVQKYVEGLKQELGEATQTVSEFQQSMKQIDTLSSVFERAGLEYDATQQKLSKVRKELEAQVKERATARKTYKEAQNKLGDLGSELKKQSEKVKAIKHLAVPEKVKKDEVAKLKKAQDMYDKNKQAMKDANDTIGKANNRIDELVKLAKELSNQFFFSITETDKMAKAFNNLSSGEIGPFVSHMREIVSGQKEEIEQRKILGMSYKTQQKQLDTLRKKAEELGISWEGLINSTQKVKTAFGEALQSLNWSQEKLAKSMGITVNTLGNLQSAVSTLTSGFMEVARATDKLSPGASARIGGITSAAQSALSGNWLQAIMDLFTGFMTGWIEDLKAKKEKLQRQLDTTFSMANEGLQTFTQELSNATRELAGPFGSAIDGALDGFTGFFKMTQQFVRGDIIDMMQTGFSALMSIVSGVASSFIGLLQKSDQWQALQEELDPIWKALANALGTLLTPLVALARWLREYLGIQKEVNKEISDLNVPSGFKRARKVWEAGSTGPGAGEDEGMKIPQWAKEIIKPIKSKLIPYLRGSKNFLQGIRDWAKGIWGWLQDLILKYIPDIAKGIAALFKWINKVNWKAVLTYIGAMGKWFIKKFPEAWAKFKKKFDEFWKGTFGGGGFLETIKNIDKTLAAIAKSMGVAASTIGGAGIGAAIGGAVAGPGGALIGGAIGAGLGALAGWLGFQEGGIVTSPVPGIVGEAGPEAVIPLDRLGDFTGLQNINVRLDIDGRELSGRISQVDDRERYARSGVTTGGYGRETV